MKKTVLVGVLKSKSDLRLLLEEKWYRIPLAFLPKRRFTHIAFYQPQTAFGKAGKRIEYYARISKREAKKRIELLPGDVEHPRAHDDYLKYSFRTIEKLKKPIRNIIPRRISFGFTSLATLRSARDILELYGVPPTEKIIERALRCLHIPFLSQYRISLNSPFVKGVSGRSLLQTTTGQGIFFPPFQGGDKRGGSKRYRLDLAILCARGNLAIECDNRKAHSGKLQKWKDRQKDAALRRLGWRVIRLTEAEIVENLEHCISRIRKAVHSLGGIPRNKGGGESSSRGLSSPQFFQK